MSNLSPLPEPTVPLFTKPGIMSREWYLWFRSVDEWIRDTDGNTFLTSLLEGILALADGVTAPTAVVGTAFEYVDTADGDLKIRYGNNFTKLIVADS